MNKIRKLKSKKINSDNDSNDNDEIIFHIIIYIYHISIKNMIIEYEKR